MFPRSPCLLFWSQGLALVYPSLLFSFSGADLQTKSRTQTESELKFAVPKWERHTRNTPNAHEFITCVARALPQIHKHRDVQADAVTHTQCIMTVLLSTVALSITCMPGLAVPQCRAELYIGETRANAYG